MSDEHLAAVLFAAGGLAMSSLFLRSDRTLTPSQWYSLTWPRSVDADQVEAFFRFVAADRRRHIVALEAIGHAGQVTFRLGMAERLAPSLLASLRSYIPGVDAAVIQHDVTTAPTLAWHLTLSTKRRTLRVKDVGQIARALITSLASTTKHDTVILQWLLGPRLAPITVPDGHVETAESWMGAVKQAATGSRPMHPDAVRALRDKVGEPGFRASCRIGVASSSDAGATAIAGRLLNALRTAEAPGIHLDLKPEPADRIATARPAKDWPVSINVKELTALSAWPVGDRAYPGIGKVKAVTLAPSGRIPAKGRVIAEATAPGSQRPLTLSPHDALRHLHLMAPTGAGKSTLMLNLISQDMADGRGVVVIDPKGDLIEDVLARVPDKRAGDVVVIDPTDESRPVGLNVLKAAGRSPELIADQVLAVFHGLYHDSWGPRTQDVLHASLLTIAGRPGMTLCSLPVLLSNARY